MFHLSPIGLILRVFPPTNTPRLGPSARPHLSSTTHPANKHRQTRRTRQTHQRRHGRHVDVGVRFFVFLGGGWGGGLIFLHVPFTDELMIAGRYSSINSWHSSTMTPEIEKHRRNFVESAGCRSASSAPALCGHVHAKVAQNSENGGETCPKVPKSAVPVAPIWSLIALAIAVGAARSEVPESCGHEVGITSDCKQQSESEKHGH